MFQNLFHEPNDWTMSRKPMEGRDNIFPLIPVMANYYVEDDEKPELVGYSVMYTVVGCGNKNRVLERVR